MEGEEGGTREGQGRGGDERREGRRKAMNRRAVRGCGGHTHLVGLDVVCRVGASSLLVQLAHGVGAVSNPHQELRGGGRRCFTGGLATEHSHDIVLPNQY